MPRTDSTLIVEVFLPGSKRKKHVKFAFYKPEQKEYMKQLIRVARERENFQTPENEFYGWVEFEEQIWVDYIATKMKIEKIDGVDTLCVELPQMHPVCVPFVSTSGRLILFNIAPNAALARKMARAEVRRIQDNREKAEQEKQKKAKEKKEQEQADGTGNPVGANPIAPPTPHKLRF